MSKKKIATKNGLTVHVCLDRSGSMHSIKDDTIGAFNSYVENLRKEHPDAFISLTIFDSGSIDTIIENVAVKNSPNLTDEMYQPRAMTPLLDAIGKCVNLLSEAEGKNKALVIITDGHENYSKEYSKATIKKLLDEKQDKDGWLVLFLGANIDAFAEGGSLGMRQDTTLLYNATGGSMRAAFAAAARSTNLYGATGQNISSGFTDDERKKAEAE